MADKPGPGNVDVTTTTTTPPPTPTAASNESSPATSGRPTAVRTNSDSLVRKALHQSADAAHSERRLETSRGSEPDTSCIYSQRAFKKSSQNGKLTLYLASRDLIVTAGKIDKLQGVLLIDPEILQDKKEVLVKRFHPNAHPFTMAVTPLAPPSVQLVPAKEYNGAPIGTSYDVRIYAAERPDEKLTRKIQIIRMGIRVIQGAHTPPPLIRNQNIVYGVPTATESIPGTRTTSPTLGGKPQRQKSTSAEDENEIKADDEPPIPHAVVEKQFLLSDGRVRLEASLDRAIYAHGESITVNVNVTNNSGKSVKRIEADIVQHVDVCMFSNGKFKNIVAQMSSREGCPVETGFSLSRTYTLRPEKGTTKNWIALEDDPGYAKAGGNLASTVVCSGTAPEDRNVFAIYVSYYVKVKIVVSPIGEWIGGVISLKLPFILMHSNTDLELYGTPMTPFTGCRILNKIETVDDPNEDPLPFIDKDNTSDEEQSEATDKKSDEKPTTTAATNGESIGMTVFAPPIPTKTVATIAKLMQSSSVETTTTKCVVLPKERRRDSMSKVDLIEHYEDKVRKDDSDST